VTLAAPALAAVYFIAAVYGRRRLGPVVQGALSALGVLVLPFNVQDGLDRGSARCATMEAFEQDVRAGAPLGEVAARYCHDVYFHGGNIRRRLFALRLAVLQEAGMEPYRLLQRDPAAEAALADGHNPDYPRVVQHVRKEVSTRLPRGAVVLIVSHGDDDLLKMDGPVGWHFPQTQGEYTPAKPGSSAEAVTHLEGLRAQGARYIVFPRTAFWWLKDYPGLTTHLDRHARPIYHDEDCTIYQFLPNQ
jgi:hypothetical protein